MGKGAGSRSAFLYPVPCPLASCPGESRVGQNLHWFACVRVRITENATRTGGR